MTDLNRYYRTVKTCKCGNKYGYDGLAPIGRIYTDNGKCPECINKTKGNHRRKKLKHRKI